MGLRIICSALLACVVLAAPDSASLAGASSPDAVERHIGQRIDAGSKRAASVTDRIVEAISAVQRSRAADALPSGLLPTIDPYGNATAVAAPRQRSIPDRVAAQPCTFPNCDRPLRGGTGLGYDARSYCTAGFIAVAADGENFLVTAGHCGPSDGIRARFFAKSPSRFNSETLSRSWQIGVNSPSMTVFGPLDYMAVRIDRRSIWLPRVTRSFFSEWDADGRATQFVGARDPILGEPVCKSSISTGVTCGTVLAVDASVTVGDARLQNAFVTSACSLDGDSGGPYVGADGALLGILSGGTGLCPSGPGSGLSVAQSAESILEHSGLRMPIG